MPTLAIFAICLVGAAVFGWIMHALFVREAEKRALSMRNSIAGQAGREKRAEIESRIMLAATEVFTRAKAGEPIVEVLKDTAGKYPDVALYVAKKTMKGNLPAGLQDILGGAEGG